MITRHPSLIFQAQPSMYGKFCGSGQTFRMSASDGSRCVSNIPGYGLSNSTGGRTVGIFVVVCASANVAQQSATRTSNRRIRASPEFAGEYWITPCTLWDAEPIGKLEGHADRVLSAAFSPDGKRIV